MCHTERQVRFCDLLTDVAILRVGYYFYNDRIFYFNVNATRVNERKYVDLFALANSGQQFGDLVF